MPRRITLFFIVLLLITSCHTGYKKENGKWVWITYDEAAGKRVKQIDSADQETFKILSNENYATDKNKVYYNANPIKKANPKTFTVLSDNGYSKDDKKVYLDLDEIIFADPNTFEILNYPYSKDKDNVFCGTLPIRLSKDEIAEFRVTNKDELMADMRTSTLKSSFIENNPDYKWLDTLDVEGIIIGEYGTGETKKRKFVGYKEKK